MISDKEKERIVERIKLEIEIRNTLMKKPSEEKSSREPWWQSKLGILIIGALISGILIPLFQYSQETFKWSRQNRYDNLKYRLEMVRNGMKELTFCHAFVAEAYERSQHLIDSKSLSGDDLVDYQRGTIEMHNRRFKQNAKFANYFSYLPNNERTEVRESFQQYISSVQAYMNLLEKIVAEKATMQKGSPGRFIDSLKVLEKEINNNYERTLNKIRTYQMRLENEGNSYM